MFSMALRSASSWGSCATYPTVVARRSAICSSVASPSDVPPTMTVPVSMGCRPARHSSNVDLPAPERPVTTATSPDRTMRSTPESTVCRLPRAMREATRPEHLTATGAAEVTTGGRPAGITIDAGKLQGSAGVRTLFTGVIPTRSLGSTASGSSGSDFVKESVASSTRERPSAPDVPGQVVTGMMSKRPSDGATGRGAGLAEAWSNQFAGRRAASVATPSHAGPPSPWVARASAGSGERASSPTAGVKATVQGASTVSPNGASSAATGAPADGSEAGTGTLSPTASDVDGTVTRRRASESSRRKSVWLARSRGRGRVIVTRPESSCSLVMTARRGGQLAHGCSSARKASGLTAQ